MGLPRHCRKPTMDNYYTGNLKARLKASSSNVVGIFTRETEEDVASLTSSREEESALAADTGTPFTSKTGFGKQYLK